LHELLLEKQEQISFIAQEVILMRCSLVLEPREFESCLRKLKRINLASSSLMRLILYFLKQEDLELKGAQAEELSISFLLKWMDLK